MKVTKEESENRNWLWVKTFEKKLLVNLLKAQDFLMMWRAFICSREFWNLSWLWMAFLMKLCSLRIRFSVGQGHRKKLMSWVSSLVPKPYLDKGFPDCFKDGILLCALTDKLANGACPRYDLLDPDQPLRNLKLALYLIEKHIKIKPVITADEIFQGSKFTEKRLVLLIAHMKLASEKLNLSSNKVENSKDFLSKTTFVSDKCFARGMGLLLAVRGRKACFTILLDSTDNLDMVIEIRGPRNTACSKRITSVHSLMRSDSQDIRDIQDAQIKQEILSKKIPLTYRILGRKITVSYSPLESGKHHMSIIWQGQHIMGSPYTITVDSSVESPDIWYQPPKKGYNRLKRTDSQYYEESTEGRMDSGLATCLESAATVTRRRVLRYIVKMDGNDVVIDGKEDLCKAIKYLKNHEQNLSSEAEDNWESQDESDSDWISKCESETVLQNNNETENSLCPDAAAILEEDFNEFSQIIEPKTDNDTISDSKCKDAQLLSRNVSECVTDRVTTMENKKTSAKNKNTFELDCEQGKSFTTDSTSTMDFGRSEVSDSFSKEQHHINTSDIESDKTVNDHKISLSDNNQSEEKPQIKVTFLDESDEECNLSYNPRNFLNNNMNLDIRDSSSHGDDFNFFPVHKVEYEILHDDDSEDPANYNPGRRTSFTELNESNYLDDDINETEVVDAELDDNIHSETEKEDYQKENDAEYQKEINGYSGNGIRNCLRTNHSLFQCDHSLSLFTESVVETPPELANSENEEREPVSVSNIVNVWENELKNLKSEPLFDDGRTEEIYKSDENTNVEYVNEDPSITPFSVSNVTEGFDPFSSQNTGMNLFDSEEFDSIIKANLQDLCDKRKRSSWPDRDLLPAIRESSVEGLLESETHDEKIRNQEISESNSYFNETKIKSNPDTQYATISSTTVQNVSDIDEKLEIPVSTSLFKGFQLPSEKCEKIKEFNEVYTNADTNSSSGRKTDISPKIESLENNFKRPFSSMNILSASPYKNRNQDSKLSEIKFSTAAYVDRYTNQISPTNPPTTTNSSNVQNVADTFILTYAKPIIIEECQNEDEFPKQDQDSLKENISDKTTRVADYQDSSEQKSAQCLSVKKVIQIFQKEKEEPVDTWPTETETSPYCRKIFKEDVISPKNKEMNDLPESENCLFTPFAEISRSSIKDRVKLFEREEKHVPSVKKPGTAEKRSSSSISAKKDYWESFAS